MEPVDLLCSRNARPLKDGEGAARCPSCSQNAHGKNCARLGQERVSARSGLGG